MPPYIAKRRTTANLKKKQKNKQTNKKNPHQNCQKIELDGSLTTKELKLFIQTRRRSRDGQQRWKGLVAKQWLVDQARWQLVEQVVLRFHAIIQEEQLGSKTNHANPGLQHGQIKPQNL